MRITRKTVFQKKNIYEKNTCSRQKEVTGKQDKRIRKYRR